MQNRLDFSDLRNPAQQNKAANKFDFSDLRKPQEESLLQKAGNIAGKFNQFVEASRLPALAGGLLQGTSNVGASLANVPLEIIGKAIGKDLRQPAPNINPYEKKDTLSNLAFGAGELGAPVGGALKVANKIPGLSQIAKVPYVGQPAAKALGGAAAGAAIGETPEGDRTLGALVGGAANPVLGAAKYASDILNPLAMAKRVLTGAKAEKEKYRGLYQNFFKGLEEKGLGELDKPKINLDRIKKYTPEKQHGSVLEFYKNPTLENAHWAQSDLGKIERNLENRYNRIGLPSSELKLWEEVKKAKNAIQISMKDTLKSKASPAHAEEYEKLGQGYLNDVIPYEKSAEGKAAKKALEKDKLTRKIEKKHPEIGHSRKIKSLLGLGKIGKEAAIPGSLLYLLFKDIAKESPQKD